MTERTQEYFEEQKKEILAKGERKVSMAKKLRVEFDKMKNLVLKRQWDYISCVAGLPGAGKSTFARGAAAYVCPWFNIDYIVFDAQDFIDVCNNCPEGSAIVYDECFADMNTRQTVSPDFMRIINHLQLIRKRHLFVFLCLPNFFDLSKGIAIFRTSHLFVTYATVEGDRGRVMAFSRNNKRWLYVKGSKFMNYNAQKSNFATKFFMNKHIVDEDAYEAKKDKLLRAKDDALQKKGTKKEKVFDKLDKSVLHMKKLGKSNKEIGKTIGFSDVSIGKRVKVLQEYGYLPQTTPKLSDIKPQTAIL